MANDETTCPLTKVAGASWQRIGDGWEVSSPVVGTFKLSGSAETELSHLKSCPPQLVTWVIDQHRLGVGSPEVTTYVLGQAKDTKPLATSQRTDRFLRFLKSLSPLIGAMHPWSGASSQSGGAKGGSNRDRAKAWTESHADVEISTIVEYLISKGHVKHNGPNYVGLTLDGWNYLEDQDRLHIASNQGFVAMWFGPEVSSAYHDGIAPAIREAGYVPMRIDQKEHANRIDDEIIAEIRRSRFVVADFTCGVVDDGGKPVAIPRGGVYYEAGFAQGLGIPVIWMCREDHINHVHFDTRQFNHITWTDAADLRKKLKNRIGAVLGDGPNVHHEATRLLDHGR